MSLFNFENTKFDNIPQIKITRKDESQDPKKPQDPLKKQEESRKQQDEFNMNIMRTLQPNLGSLDQFLDVSQKASYNLISQKTNSKKVQFNDDIFEETKKVVDKKVERDPFDILLNDDDLNSRQTAIQKIMKQITKQTFQEEDLEKVILNAQQQLDQKIYDSKMESKLQHIKYIKSLNLKNLSDKLKMYKEVLCGDKSLISMEKNITEKAMKKKSSTNQKTKQVSEEINQLFIDEKRLNQLFKLFGPQIDSQRTVTHPKNIQNKLMFFQDQLSQANGFKFFKLESVNTDIENRDFAKENKTVLALLEKQEKKLQDYKSTIQLSKSSHSHKNAPIFINQTEEFMVVNQSIEPIALNYILTHQSFTPLRVIRLQNVNLPKNIFHLLLRYINYECVFLNELDLSHNLCDQSMAELTCKIIEGNHLETLNLNNMNLTTKLLIIICYGLAKHKCIINLNLQHNVLDCEDTIRYLIKYLPSLTLLQINENKITDYSAIKHVAKTHQQQNTKRKIIM